MVESGVPVAEALRAYSSRCRSLDTIVRQMHDSLLTGGSLSASLARYPETFNPIYVGLVRVGERSGRLVTVLRKLAERLESSNRLRLRLVASLTYPGLLCVASLGSVVLFLVFILPAIEPVFTAAKAPLPWSTQILLGFSHLLRHPAMVFLFFALFEAVWLGRPWMVEKLKAQDDTALRLGRILLSAPVFGPFYRKLVYSRVLSSLASLLDAGLRLPEALSVTANGVSGNPAIDAKLLATRDGIESGETLTRSFARHAVLPAGAVKVIAVGEEVSRLPRMLRALTRMYENEVDLALVTMVALVEPLVLLVMGAVVSFLVLASGLPTIELINHL